MTLIRTLCALAALTLPPVVHADIYKCVDEIGRITYTNAKPTSKGCTVLSRDLPKPAPTRTAPKSESPRDDAARVPELSTSSSGFPKVDAGTQQVRDTNRRSILERELMSEEKLLAEARQDALRNYANAPGAQLSSEKVQLHERNIQALRKEISKLK
jgi:hypothetical protein